MKYTSPYWSDKTGEALTTKSHGDENNQSTVITFNGSGRIDSISVNAIKLFGVPEVGNIGNVDSKDYFLPISYRYKIIIRAGTFEISNKVRFITGSTMIINRGAQVNFSTAAMFYQSFTDKASVFPYPSKSAAKLIYNGKAVFSTWFGGEILTEGSSASLEFKDGFIDNCSNTEMNGDENMSVNFKAHGKIATSKTSNDPIDMGFAKKCTYLSNVSHWYYDSISVDSCFTINEDPKVSINEDSRTFSVGLKLIISSFDTRIINIDSAECVWAAPSSQGSLKNIKITPKPDDKCTCSITGDVTAKEKTVIPVSVKVTLKQGLSSTLTYNITVDAKSACLIPDTMVAMADGSYKRAGDIKVGDMVLSFNHETGKVEASKIILNPETEIPASLYDVVTLKFSDNSEVGVIGDHGFFDMTLNKYIYINKDNYKQYIGHQFYGFKHGTTIPEITTLIAGSVKETFTTICSPVSANNLNIITEDKLGISGEIEGLFNFFDYDPVTLKYDEAKKEADIAKYGLLAYEDFKDLLPYEVYEVLPCQYMSVSIGKGLITWDKIKEYINHWSDQLIQ